MPTYSKKKLNQIVKRHGIECFYCKQNASGGTYKGFHIDHVIPRSKGGSDDVENLVPVCMMCNSFKSNFTIDEWRIVIKYKLNKLAAEHKKLKKLLIRLNRIKKNEVSAH